MKETQRVQLLGIVSLGFSVLASAGEVTLTLHVRNPQLIFGEPLVVDVALTNESPSTLKLPLGPTSDVGPAIDFPVLVDPNGQRQLCEEIWFSTTAGSYKGEDGGYFVPTAKAITARLELAFPRTLAAVVGKQDLQATYEASGRVLAQAQLAGAPPMYACNGCWKGEVSSAIQAVTLSAPEGVDREAYDYFKGEPLSDPMRAGELLQKFPGSTYAAYAILKYAGPPTFEPSDEKSLSYLAAALRTGSLLSNSYPDDIGTGHNGWKSLQGEAAARWIDKWCEAILINHPNIWFADDLRLKRAVDEVALKNFQQGETLLNGLAADPKSTAREKASACLGVMRKQGWIK